MGFSIPLDSLLRNDLNKEVKEVIFDNLDNSTDQINKLNVETIWRDFMNGNNASYRVYALYNFLSGNLSIIAFSLYKLNKKHLVLF